MLLAIPSLDVQAKSDYMSDDFCYTVRLFAGDQGTFKDNGNKDYYTFKGKPGTTLDLTKFLDSSRIELEPEKDPFGEVMYEDEAKTKPMASKYYIKGLRESGKDNNTVFVSNVITFDRDADYVIAYALEGGDVTYTIKYVDDKGNEIAPSETHFGNVGEKPVVAYKYIDGYVPNALALTKTLLADEDKNVFTFKYTPGDPSRYNYVIIDGDLVITYADGGVVYEYEPGDVIYIGGGAGGNVNVVDQGGVAIGDGDVPLDGGPANLIDLDDEDVPLSGFDLDFDYKDATAVGFLQLPTLLKALIIISFIALVAVAGFVITSIVKRRKEKVKVEK